MFTSPYPKWDHGWEVEWRDAGTDAQGHADGVGVHVLGDARHGLPELQGRDTAAVLHHLYRNKHADIGARSSQIIIAVPTVCCSFLLWF